MVAEASQVGALGASDSAITFKNLAIALQPEYRAKTAATEGVRQHLPPVAKHESWIVSDDGRHVPRLHPALRAPPLVLDFPGLEMLRGDNGGGAVVLLHAIDLDQVAGLKIFR